jgi:hypothetical protein
VFLGSNDYLPPNDIFSRLLAAEEAAGDLVSNANPGYRIGKSGAVFGQLRDSTGALIAQGAGTFTIGTADIYAIIATPAA